MTSAITSKKNKDRITYYYDYRCDTLEPRKCQFKGKGVRAHVVIDYLVDFLQRNSLATRQVYNPYVAEMQHVIKEQEALLETQKRSITRAKVELEDKILKIKELLLREKDIFVKDTFTADL